MVTSMTSTSSNGRSKESSSASTTAKGKCRVFVIHIRKVLTDEFLFNNRNGTSMVTLVIPPKETMQQITAFLNKEHAEAANIKSK